MQVGIDMGCLQGGTTPVLLDLEELLATRLLVQGNSGSGKSHLLRRLLEQSVPWVQQLVIDPEGDFVTLAERFGHVVIDSADHSESGLTQIAGRMRQHRVSVVLNLENQEIDRQMRSAAAFLNGAFDAPREWWHAALVVIDEAQMFAPAAAGDVSDEARKMSLAAMTNLMSRGRKRGLAGVIATQRLAKLAKNVAAEASNFLMGRTFLDIDMSRAADLLGMERRQAEMFRDLGRGSFVALGPALSRRPLKIQIGVVETQARATSPRLVPLPSAPEDARELILTPGPDEALRPLAVRSTPLSTAEVLSQLSRSAEARAAERAANPPPSPIQHDPQSEDYHDALAEAEPPPPASLAPQNTQGAFFDEVLREVLKDPEAAFRSPAVLYQDFLVRCRGHGVNGRALTLPQFRRRLAGARAGVSLDIDDNPEWERARAVATDLPEDLQAMFLLLAQAALDGAPCPSDEEIARVRGSRSPRRARGLLTYMEERGLLTTKADVFGQRIIALPSLGWETGPARPEGGVVSPSFDGSAEDGSADPLDEQQPQAGAKESTPPPTAEQNPTPEAQTLDSEDIITNDIAC